MGIVAQLEAVNREVEAALDVWRRAMRVADPGSEPHELAYAVVDHLTMLNRSMYIVIGRARDVEEIVDETRDSPGS